MHCLSAKREFAKAAVNKRRPKGLASRRSDSEETTGSVSISCLNNPERLSSGMKREGWNFVKLPHIQGGLLVFKLYLCRYYGIMVESVDDINIRKKVKLWLN